MSQDKKLLPDMLLSIDSFEYLIKKIDTCIYKLSKHCCIDSNNEQETCVELSELKNNLITSNTESTKWIIR